MKLVETLVVRDDDEMLTAHLAFQFAMGVDFVVAAAPRGDERIAEVLEPYERDAMLRLVSLEGEHEGDGAVRGELERLAVAEHGADWVLDAEPDELWLPRGASLPAILTFLPSRYSVVQALVRVFPPRPAANGQVFWERMTVRPSLLGLAAVAGPLDRALRPVLRATLVGDRARPVPLRAWYPIEVLRFPLRSLAQAERRLRGGGNAPRSMLEDAAVALDAEGRLAAGWGDIEVDDERLALGLLDGSLVVDERARAVLGERETGGSSGIVADASYAIECAAVGEVDVDVLLARISALERGLAGLERRFWPRVLRRLERVFGH